jgi:hypothetical protein
MLREPGLLAVHERARLLFGRPLEPPFFPHLSLAYAELPAPSRRSLLSELSPLLPFAARLDVLQVVCTEGRVRDWRPLATFPLSGRA